MKHKNMTYSKLFSSVLLAASTTTFAHAYTQGQGTTALINSDEIVVAKESLRQEEGQNLGLFDAVRNRTANPVRIIWYGHPGDADGEVPQDSVINKGKIRALLFGKGLDSETTIQNQSSLTPDGVGNAIDAYGWTSVNNRNDVIYTIKEIKNYGSLSANGNLESGSGDKSYILTNATSNGISLYASTDYGEPADLSLATAADGSSAVSSGSRRVSASRTTNSLASQPLVLKARTQALSLTNKPQATDWSTTTYCYPSSYECLDKLRWEALHEDGSADPASIDDVVLTAEEIRDAEAYTWSSKRKAENREKALAKKKYKWYVRHNPEEYNSFSDIALNYYELAEVEANARSEKDKIRLTAEYLNKKRDLWLEKHPEAETEAQTIREREEAERVRLEKEAERRAKRAKRQEYAAKEWSKNDYARDAEAQYFKDRYLALHEPHENDPATIDEVTLTPAEEAEATKYAYNDSTRDSYKATALFEKKYKWYLRNHPEAKTPEEVELNPKELQEVCKFTLSDEACQRAKDEKLAEKKELWLIDHPDYDPNAATANDKAEEEARRKQEEADRKKAEEEAHRKQEENDRKKAEEARRKQEEADRKKAEEEANKSPTDNTPVDPKAAKSLDVKLELLHNEGNIAATINAKGSQDAGKGSDTDVRYLNSITFDSGNGVSIHSYVWTPDHLTWNEQKVNKATLGKVVNKGNISGHAELLAAGTYNATVRGYGYTKARQSGNGINVSAVTLVHAKHDTYTTVGDIENSGHISGYLSAITPESTTETNNIFNLNFTGSEATNSGNGIGVFSEADSHGTNEVITTVGNVENQGRISGSAYLEPSKVGTGDLTIKAYGSGNGISVYTQGDSVNTNKTTLGNVNNSGLISGSFLGKGALARGALDNNDSFTNEEVKFMVTTPENYSKVRNTNQVPPARRDVNSYSPFSDKSNMITRTDVTIDAYGVGNGISVHGHKGSSSHEIKLGDINNSGVISGYSRIYHGMAREYGRATTFGDGMGIALASTFKSKVNNKGIISGNHAALMAQGNINDAYSVFNPEFESGFEQKIDNYGLMAGTLIAASFSTRTNTSASSQAYNYFESSESVENKGLKVFFKEGFDFSKYSYINGAPRNEKSEYIERVEKAANSEATIDGVNYHIINGTGYDAQGQEVTDSNTTIVDTYTKTTEATIDKTIINGTGVKEGALSTDHDLVVSNSIVNGLVQGLTVANDSTLKLDHTIVNANGFKVRVLENDQVVEKATYALKADDHNTTLVLASATINGNVDLGNGENKVIFANGNNHLNGQEFNLGNSGNNSLVLGATKVPQPLTNSLTSLPLATFASATDTADYDIVLNQPLTGVNKLEINQSTYIREPVFTNTEFKDVVVKNHVLFEGNFVLAENGRLEIQDDSKVSQFATKDGNIDLSKGTLFLRVEDLDNRPREEGQIKDVLKIYTSKVQGATTDPAPTYSISLGKVESNSPLFNYEATVVKGGTSLSLVPKSLVGGTPISKNANALNKSLAEAIEAELSKDSSTNLAAKFYTLNKEIQSRSTLNSEILNNIQPLFTGNTALLVANTVFTGKEINTCDVLSNSACQGLWFKLNTKSAKAPIVNLASDFKSTTQGLALGANYHFAEQSTAGVHLGFSKGSNKNQEFSAKHKLNVNTLQVGLSLQQVLRDNLAFSLVAGGAISQLDANRYVNILNKDYHAHAKTNATSFYTGLGLTLDFSLNANSKVQPYARLDWINTSVKAYTETGAQAWNLNVRKQTQNQLWATVGAQANYNFSEQFSASLDLATSYNALSDKAVVRAGLISGTNQEFSVSSKSAKYKVVATLSGEYKFSDLISVNAYAKAISYQSQKALGINLNVHF